MVLWIMKWDINPDKVDSYAEWAQGAIPSVIGAGGVVEFRGYRPVSGDRRVVVTVEFADLATWQSWYESDTVQDVLAGMGDMVLNLETELWGPSPVVPQPIRPGG